MSTNFLTDMNRTLERLATELTKSGVKVYVNKNPDSNYFFATNGKAVFAINCDAYYGEVDVCYKYVPNRVNGSACQIFSPNDNVTAGDIVEALNNLSEPTFEKLRRYNRCIKENVGLQEKQRFYADAQDWLDHHWNKDKLTLFTIKDK